MHSRLAPDPFAFYWASMGPEPKKKNNHFVPRSYLKRFCAGSERQVGLYNFNSDVTVESAPIRSQCSKDYFYTKNPAFEKEFTNIEGIQKRLLDDIINYPTAPALGTDKHSHLIQGVMFQAVTGPH